ncbi:MAG: LPS export ABC transporter periplasmic protein LptC [Spirochaetaceae bacterium]|nr:LPS export ABC transporter periplasmic protein LptC [Spirochaetaceae bacterium]
MQNNKSICDEGSSTQLFRVLLKGIKPRTQFHWRTTIHSFWSRAVIIILLIGFATACSFDYKEAMVAEEISGGIPNAIVINLEETVIKKGTIAYSLKAERAETYDKRNLTVFKNIQFVEYDKAGETATEGEVGNANYYSDTENMEFDKSFKLESLQQGYFIEGDSLFWDGKEKVLVSDFEKEITIGKENGSYITGKGFNSKASNNSFNFEGGVTGVYISEDDEEKEGEDNEYENDEDNEEEIN